MKHLVFLILAAAAFGASAEYRSDARIEFDARAATASKANTGELMYVPKMAIACPSRESGIKIHNYLLAHHDGQYTRSTVAGISDTPCRVAGHNSAGFIVERVEGSSFVKLEYTDTPTTIVERWFYLPAIRVWGSERKLK